jgi:hypothetical protein
MITVAQKRLINYKKNSAQLIIIRIKTQIRYRQQKVNPRSSTLSVLTNHQFRKNQEATKSKNHVRTLRMSIKDVYLYYL